MDWMGQLPAYFHNRPLIELAIPGSHDSMTYSLDINSEIGPDTDPRVKSLIKCFCYMGRKVVYKWSVTQNLNITAQLEAGIRYVDLRIGRKENGEIGFLHALYGMNIKEGLQEIRQFVDRHPKEVILLDFNHFYNLANSDHQKVIGIIQEIFNNKLCPPDVSIDVLFLNTLWHYGYQVIVFYQSQEVFMYQNLWPAQFIQSPWPNTPDVDTMIEFLNENKRHQKNIFFATQGIVTPTQSTIVKHLCGSLKQTLAMKANNSVVKWLQENRGLDVGFNIIIVDFVETKNFISTVLSLNEINDNFL